jgi:hypothetical protein
MRYKSLTATQTAKFKKMLNNTQAQHYLQQHANANTISAAQVQALLANVSVTFANIAYVTQVATAAAHKHNNVQKVTVANVQLFANIKAATSVFALAVKRSAAQHASNDVANVQQFEAQSNYFAHTACYSIVQHKQTQAQYLYAIYNNASSIYFINNVVATKQQVAALLTASAASKLLQASNTVHNVTHNVTHNVQVRTVALANIVSIVANKQQLAV